MTWPPTSARMPEKGPRGRSELCWRTVRRKGQRFRRDTATRPEVIVDERTGFWASLKRYPSSFLVHVAVRNFLGAVFRTRRISHALLTLPGCSDRQHLHKRRVTWDVCRRCSPCARVDDVAGDGPTASAFRPRT
jgi:hypothetical protein